MFDPDNPEEDSMIPHGPLPGIRRLSFAIRYSAPVHLEYGEGQGGERELQA